MNVSPGFEVIFTMIRSESTFVPPVTARLTDHRRRFTCDRRFVDTRDALEDPDDDVGLVRDKLSLVLAFADPAVGDAALGYAVLGGGEVLTGDAACGVLGGLERHHAHHAGHVTVAVVDEIHAATGCAGYRPLHVLDDVDEIFEVPGLTDEPVEVVEDDSVDDAMGQVSEQLAELGTQDHPVDGAVGLDDLPLFEGRGVVLPVDLRKRAPAQAAPGVLGVFELAVDAGFEAEAVGGDAQIGSRPFGGVGGQVVVEVEGDLAPTGVRGDVEVLPDSHGCRHGVGSWCSSAPIPGTFRRTQGFGGAVDPL